jgi:CRISPR-associated protein Cas2
MQKIMNEEQDSLIIYSWRTERYTKREIIGVKKGGLETII